MLLGISEKNGRWTVVQKCSFCNIYLLLDGYDEYEFSEDDMNLIPDTQQELQDMFFGLKDFESFDEMSDQTMADSINNIGTMVLGNIDKNVTKINADEPMRINYKTDR